MHTRQEFPKAREKASSNKTQQTSETQIKKGSTDFGNRQSGSFNFFTQQILTVYLNHGLGKQ